MMTTMLIMNKVFVSVAITVMCVSCHQFDHQNQQKSFNRNNLRPNDNQSPEPPVSQNMFSGRAHPRPESIGFEDRAQRPPENRHSIQLHSGLRQEMPYQSNDHHLRPNNGITQELVSQSTPEANQLTRRRGDITDETSPLKNTKPVHEMPFYLPPKYIENSNSYRQRIRKHPEIFDDPRNLRIQSTVERDRERERERERDFNDNLQNIDRSNDWRPIHPKAMDRNPKTFGYNNNDVNHNPLPHLSQTHRRRNIGRKEKRHRFRPNPQDLGLKMVLPKNREESRVNGFESFSTNHNHEEIDKIYPKHERNQNHNLLNDIPAEELPMFKSGPDNEVEYQRYLNRYPPVLSQEEEIRKFSEPFDDYRRGQRSRKQRHRKHNRHSNGEHIPNYLRNHFKQHKHPSDEQHLNPLNQRNEANHRDIHQNIHNKPGLHYRPIDRIVNDFQNDDSNDFGFQRSDANHERKGFYRRQTTQKPELDDNTYGMPMKKEIEIVREITEIIPFNEDRKPFNDHLEPSMATPAPPEPPNIPGFDIDEKVDADKEEDRSSNDDETETTKRPIKSSREDSFYDDEDERRAFGKTKDLFGLKSLENDDSEENNKNKNEKKSNKSKFEKEVDLSADELENYFDKEFANEAEKDDEGQKRIDFKLDDDEPKESKQVSKKEETEDTDVEADYKSSSDFLKNHDDFLNKIEKENEKFRKRTDDKVEKEEEEETEDKGKEKKVDDGEKELDGEVDKKDEETEDKTQSEQKTNKDDNNSTEEEETNDSNEESKDKTTKQTEGEEEEESETKEGTEKEEKKSEDNNEDNQQNEEKNEEQEDDSGAKDEEKTDNTESDDSNEANDEKETKTDKCMENNCDKELLKEESKESKNTQQLKSKQNKPEVESKDNEEPVVKEKPENSSAEEKKSLTNPTELRISQSHNFVPLFIDLKRINPNKSNIRKGLENNESLTSRTTSATTGTTDTSPQTKHRIHSVSPTQQSSDANNGKRDDNTVENRRVVNSIKDIIRSPNHR